MTGEVASHFYQDLARNFEVFQHNSIHLLVPDISRLLVDKLNCEATFTIVVKLEQAIFENVDVVAHVVSSLNHPVLLHGGEFYRSCDGSLFPYVAGRTTSLLD